MDQPIITRAVEEMKDQFKRYLVRIIDSVTHFLINVPNRYAHHALLLAMQGFPLDPPIPAPLQPYTPPKMNLPL